VRSQLLQLMAHVFVDVLEGVKKRGRDSGSSRAILDSVAQILFAGMHQAAIGVVDDHELLCAQKVVRDDQGAQRVFRDDAAGVSNDVGVAGLQAKGANGKTRVHAGQDGEMAFGTRREFSQFVRAGIEFIGLENFVDYAHGECSLANRDRQIRMRLTPQEREPRLLAQKSRGWRLGSSLPKYS
jgi:hypothetical protein